MPVNKVQVFDQLFESYIHDLSHDGRGVGRLEEKGKKTGKACFVTGALPGEQVLWRQTKSKKSFNEGELVELVRGSADRVEPRCQYYEDCGGCQLQHLKSESQLAWKERQLKRAAEQAGIAPSEWLMPLVREPWGYRRRTRLAVSFPSKAEVQIGFRAKSSHKIVPISRCEILDGRLNNLLSALQPLAVRLRRHGLTQFELTAADEQLALCCYVKKPFDMESLGLNSRLNAQLWLRLPGQQARPVSNASDPLITQLTGNARMSFKPSQFVQVNDQMNRAMISQALELLEPDKYSRVLDLFCGAGNFSLAFAERSQYVFGVEGLEELCLQASDNALQMGQTNLDFQAMDLDRPEQYKNMAASGVNMVILDPPRAGAIKLMPWLNKLGAEKILYVSCHPATKVRDLQILKEQYRIQSMGVMDMFPHTSHVESMALMVKN